MNGGGPRLARLPAPPKVPPPAPGAPDSPDYTMDEMAGYFDRELLVDTGRDGFAVREVERFAFGLKLSVLKRPLLATSCIPLTTVRTVYSSFT